MERSGPVTPLVDLDQLDGGSPEQVGLITVHYSDIHLDFDPLLRQGAYVDVLAGGMY